MFGGVVAFALPYPWLLETRRQLIVSALFRDGGRESNSWVNEMRGKII